MQGFLLQPWTTVSCNGNSTAVFTQSETEWVDLGSYADAAFWIDVSQVTAPAGSSVQLTLQGAPTHDESYFAPLAASLTLGVTTAPTVVKSSLTSATGPFSRWVRWQLTLSNPQALPWGATFRIWVVPYALSFGFIPTQVSGCVLWLRADLGISLNSSNVSAWADQSGSGNSVAQTTGATQPTYNGSGGPNNNPYVSSSSGSHYLRSGTNPTNIPSGNLVCTTFTVQQVTGGSTSCAMGWGNAAVALAAWGLCANNHGAGVLAEETGGGNPSVWSTSLDANWHILIVTRPAGALNAGTATLYIDGVAQTFNAASSSTQTPSVDGTQPINVGTWFPSGGIDMVGGVAETGIYNRVLSSSEVTSLTRYLGARYGITVP
jgi:hypothetical protein